MGVLTVLASLGALTAAAVIIEPRLIHGFAVPGQPTRLPRQPERLNVLDGLTSLLQRSAGVLAIHRDDSSTQVMLWVEDRQGPGWLSRDELGLLVHSRLMQTVTLYAAGPAEGEPEAVEPRAAARRWFSDAWMADPGVRRVVLATGVSDMRVAPIAPRGKDGSVIRVDLTWPPDSADGSEEASAEVDAVVLDFIRPE